MKIGEYSFKPCGRASGRLSDRDGYTDGTVETEFGTVRAYAQGDAEHFHHTQLTFNYRGRIYVRCFHGKRYSHRGVVTKAYEFAREISTGVKP